MLVYRIVDNSKLIYVCKYFCLSYDVYHYIAQTVKTLFGDLIQWFIEKQVVQDLSNNKSFIHEVFAVKLSHLVKR